MERLISIAGMVVLLGIAFIISTNKKAIKLRVVFWGLALQLLFALIILSQSFFSIIGMFIFMLLIIMYMFEKDLEKIIKNKVLSGIVVLLSSAVIFAAFYFLDNSKTFIEKDKDEGTYVEVYYQEYGPYDSVDFTYFTPDAEGLKFAIGYEKEDQKYIQIEDEVYGPYDQINDFYFATNSMSWLIDYDVEEYTTKRVSSGTSESGETTYNIIVTTNTVRYVETPETVYGPLDEDFALLYSQDAESWLETTEADQFYIDIEGAMVGPYSGIRRSVMGGINAWIMAAILLFTIMAMFLKKKDVLKNNELPKLGFGIFLLVLVATFWSRGVYGKDVLTFLSDKVVAFLNLTNLGTEFLFQNLSNIEFINKYGGSFAISVLPTIIFFSAFMAILYHFGIIQVVVSAMAKFMRWTMGTSGSETLSCSANIFVGQTEAPLLIKPYLKEMTKSEIHAIMVGGFATIAGGVLAGYIQMGVDAGHLIAASVMSAPAALMIAKIMYPETEHSVTAGDVDMPRVKTSDNVVGATAAGVADGLQLALNVGAMLLAFIAIIGFLDVILYYGDKFIDGKLLGGVYANGEFKGIFPGSMKTLLGWIFSPIAFVMGVPAADMMSVGSLLGTKVAVNEFVAYGSLAQMIANGEIGSRAIIISTYALCGFANFSSIGIQVGGIGAICPERRQEIAGLGFRAMIGGAIASWLTATIAGMLIG